MEREVGEGVKALTGAGEKSAQKPVAALQAGAGEKKAQKPAVVEEVARPVSLPPEQPPGLEVVQGKGQGGLLSGLTPGVSSLTLSGVPMGNAPTLARMSETARNPPVVENRADGHGGGCQHQNENGGGTAATETTVALLERPGRSPGESSEGATRTGQLVPSAPMGPPIVYRPAEAPKVYNAAGGHQGSQMVGMSQQSMCAGVPPTDMAPQFAPTVVDPSMVTGVMAAENTNPWSAAQRVEALMSSPQTPVKELTYSMGSQDLSSNEEVKKKQQMEELRLRVLKRAEEEFLRGQAAIQQGSYDPQGMEVPKPEPDHVREPEKGHKSSQSSGGSYKTASPEQRQSEWNWTTEQPQGLQVPSHGQGGHSSYQGQDHQHMSVVVPPPSKRDA